MKTPIITAVFLTLVFSTACFAQETKKWSDEAELSFVDTGGNSDTQTVSAKNLLKYQFSPKLTGTWKAGALSGKTDNERNAERFFTELRLDYALSERLYSYVNGGWLKDKFAGVSSRYYAGPGLGYKFLNGPRNFLAGEAGLNYVIEEYTNDTDRDYLGGRLFGLYEYHFNKKNKFTQSLEYLHDFDESTNYLINSETAVISALNGNLSLKASYIVNYDHDPVPSTLDTTDTIIAIALVANF